MHVPAELRPRFDGFLRDRLGDNTALRRSVAAFYDELRQGVAAERVDVDLETVDALAAALEGLLKRVSRKTTPLHHRLIHATARTCILGPEEGRPLTDERLQMDVALVNEAIRVVKRPELTIR